MKGMGGMRSLTRTTVRTQSVVKQREKKACRGEWSPERRSSTRERETVAGVVARRDRKKG